MEAPSRRFPKGLLWASGGIVLGLIWTTYLALAQGDRGGAVVESSGRAYAPATPGIVTLSGPEGFGAPGVAPVVFSPRGLALFAVAQARLEEGQLDKALNVAASMAEGPERDATYLLVADSIVPPLASTNIEMLYSRGDRSRAAALKKINSLVAMAERAGGLTMTRLLLRAALVKRLLDETNPGPSGPGASGPDPEALQARAERHARTLSTGRGWAAPTGAQAGLILTLLLGIFGYIASKMADPFFDMYRDWVRDRRLILERLARAANPTNPGGEKP